VGDGCKSGSPMSLRPVLALALGVLVIGLAAGSSNDGQAIGTDVQALDDGVTRSVKLSRLDKAALQPNEKEESQLEVFRLQNPADDEITLGGTGLDPLEDLNQAATEMEAQEEADIATENEEAGIMTENEQAPESQADSGAEAEEPPDPTAVEEGSKAEWGALCSDKTPTHECLTHREMGQCGWEHVRSGCQETCKACDEGREEEDFQGGNVTNPCGAGKVVEDAMKGIHEISSGAPTELQMDIGMGEVHNTTKLLSSYLSKVHLADMKVRSVEPAVDYSRSVEGLVGDDHEDGIIQGIESDFNSAALRLAAKAQREVPAVRI